METVFLKDLGKPRGTLLFSSVHQCKWAQPQPKSAEGQSGQASDRCSGSRGSVGLRTSEISLDFAVLQLKFLTSVVWSQS